MHKIFGTKENNAYLDREGAYFIAAQDGKIGVIQTEKGFFLIGGGLEKGENHLACLERECREETGALPVVRGKLCSAETYMTHPTIGYFHPIQTYYYGQLQEAVSLPTEKDHTLRWMTYEQLKGKLFVPMQNWALERFAAFCEENMI